MANEYLKTTLQDRAELIAPGSEIDLWPSIHQRYTSSHAVLPQVDGGSKMKAIPKNLKMIVPVLLAFILMASLVVFTPFGKALAKTVVNFFATTDKTSFPVPEVPGSAEVNPTQIPDATPEGSIQGCEGMALSTYQCQIASAEAQIGFDAMEFPTDPQGLAFSSVTAFPTQGEIMITYDVIGGQLVLKQGMGKVPDNQWSEVPAEAVESVMVGNIPGEFVRGRFTSNEFDGSGNATWNPDAPALRLRWMDGERWFEIEKDGDTVPIEYLQLEQMIDLATSLVAKP